MKHEKDSNSTDSVGTAEFNQALSQQRAQSIKNPLVARGVDSTRIDVVCFGRQYAVASNDDAGGRHLNRRVEVVISDSSGPIAARQCGAPATVRGGRWNCARVASRA